MSLTGLAMRRCAITAMLLPGFSLGTMADTFSVSIQGQQTMIGTADRVNGYKYTTVSNCALSTAARVQCQSSIDMAAPTGNERNPSPKVGCVRSPLLVWNSTSAGYAASGDRVALKLNCPAGTTFNYTSSVPIDTTTPGLALIGVSNLTAPTTILVEVEVCKPSTVCDTLVWAVPVALANAPVSPPTHCAIVVPRTTVSSGEILTATLAGCVGAAGATVIWYLDGRVIAGGVDTSTTVTPFQSSNATQARALLQADVCVPGACQSPAAQVMFALLGAPTTSGCFDLDGDGKHLAATDGLMLTRALLGFSGAAITLNAIAPGAQRTDWNSIRQHLLNCGAPWIQSG